MSLARLAVLGSISFLGACGGAGTQSETLFTNTDANAQQIPPRPLAIGATFGTFQPSDPVGRASAHVHLYRIDLDPSRRIRLRVTSDRIDPTIEVRGPGDQHMRNDD